MNKKPLLLISTCLLAINLQATVRYVTGTGTGDMSGFSWENASNDLQEMINASAANDEIWVANGTYKPNRRADATDIITPDDRYNAFVLRKDIKIYGGFVGNETSIDQRIPSPSSGRIGETCILSGDLNGDDDGSDLYTNENAYHVVISVGDVGNACLDGFVITGGNASGGDSIFVNFMKIWQSSGGGIYNYESSPVLTNLDIRGNKAGSGGGICSEGIYHGYGINYSSPLLTDVIISGNWAGAGGGMCISMSSPVLTNVTISENWARGWYSASRGGGIHILVGSSPVLTNVTISGNESSMGGGICNMGDGGTVSLTNVIISENKADDGGGIWNCAHVVLSNVIISGNMAGFGGGMYNESFSSSSPSFSPTLTNVIISGNRASDGGGIYNSNYSSPVLTNVSISRNTAKFEGNGMYNERYSHPKVRNSIILDNGEASKNIYNDDKSTPSYSYSLVEGVTEEGVILDGIDPLFIDAANGDFRLQATSPCIDAGDKTLFNAGQMPDLSAITTDLADNPRIYGSNIDLGAYEYQSAVGVVETRHAT
jgi:hypothetical protein